MYIANLRKAIFYTQQTIRNQSDDPRLLEALDLLVAVNTTLIETKNICFTCTKTFPECGVPDVIKMCSEYKCKL